MDFFSKVIESSKFPFFIKANIYYNCFQKTVVKTK